MKRVLLSIVFIWISSIVFSQINISVNQQNVTCFGLANGSATVNATGGSPAYTYTWLPGGQMSASVSSLAPGQYTVIVADASLATNSYSFIISEPNQLLVGTQIFYDCINLCSNVALATVMGGTAPYTYVWSNGAITQQTVGALCSGSSYSIQITDANGCIDTSSFFVGYGTPITVTETHTNTSCNGICDGAISFSVSGGSGHYSYNLITWGSGWVGKPITSLNQYSLCTNGYTLAVTDSVNGCVGYLALFLQNTVNSVIPNATITSTSYNETCHNTSDGAIDVNIAGSNPGPFSYLWSNGSTTQDLTSIISGNYWVTIVDGSSNCNTLFDTISSIGTNCGSISGNVYVDNNGDCINNSGDDSTYWASIVIQPGNRYGYVNTLGDYIVNDLPFGTYSVSVNSYYVFNVPTCTTTLVTTLNSTTPNAVNNNMSVGFNSSTQPDMNVAAYSNGIVPGFVSHVNYYLYNMNNVNASGLYKVTLPSAFISGIVSCSPSNFTITGDTLIWNFNNIAFNSNAWYSPPLFSIYFTPPLNTPLGSTFTTCIYAHPNITDFDYANNSYCYSRIVTGSFDPNEKTVSPVGIGATGDIAASVTDLTYLIRFQNTGNGPAVNIVVIDTLSPNVDINSFEMLGASHNYNIDIMPGNVLRWKFNNIMLADSGSNELASHGYIQYRIKRTNNNTPGTQIKNTAYIYFDFNAPVVTTTAINTISMALSVNEKTNNKSYDVYPNPTLGLIQVFATNIVADAVKITNTLGELVYETVIQNKKATVNIQHLSNGIYFLGIYNNNELIETNKIIKQ